MIVRHKFAVNAIFEIFETNIFYNIFDGPDISVSSAKYSYIDISRKRVYKDVENRHIPINMYRNIIINDIFVLT
jgi:hypothetical protein